MDIQFLGLPSDKVTAVKAAGKDSYGLPIEVQPSGGDGIPCRHCLKQTPKGEDYLILAWRPFAGVNPYTETGPIFLCAADCKAAKPSAEVPAILSSAQYLVRGYSAEERIVYGTGQVVETPRIAYYARALLTRPAIAFVDIRSAANNCFLCRVTRVS